LDGAFSEAGFAFASNGESTKIAWNDFNHLIRRKKLVIL